MALITFKQLREIARLHYSTIPPQFEQQIREFLASLDTNGDKKLSLQELLNSSFSDGTDKDFIKQIFYGLDEQRIGNLSIEACMAIYFLCTYSKRICRSCNRPIAQGLGYTCFKCHANGVIPKFQVCLLCFSSGTYQHPHAISDMLHDYALFEQLLHHKASTSLHSDDSPGPVRVVESQQTMKQCAICGDFHESNATGFMLSYHMTQMRGSPDNFVCEWCFSYFCSNCGARFRDSTTRAEPGKWLQKFLCPPCSQARANANGYTAIVKKFHGELHKSDVMKQCKTCAIKIKNQTLFWVVNGGPGSIISSLAPSPAGNPVPPNPPIIKSRDNWPGMMHPPNVRMSGPLAPPPSGSGSANMGFFPSPHKASEFQPEPRPFPGTSGRPPTSTYASSSRGGRSSSSSDSSDEDDDSLEKKVKAGAAKLAESLGGMFNEMSINPSPSGVSGPGPGPGPGTWGSPAGPSVPGRGRGRGAGAPSFAPSIMGGGQAAPPLMSGRIPGPGPNPTYLHPKPIMSSSRGGDSSSSRGHSRSSSEDGHIDSPDQSGRGRLVGRGRGRARGAGAPSFSPSIMGGGQPAPPLTPGRAPPRLAPDSTYLQPNPRYKFQPQPRGRTGESSSATSHSRSSSDDEENVVVGGVGGGGGGVGATMLGRGRGRGRGRGPRPGRGRGRGGRQNADNIAEDDPNAPAPGANNNNRDEYDRDNPRDNGPGPGYNDNGYDNREDYDRDRNNPRDDGRGPGYYNNSYDDYDGNGRDRNDNNNNNNNNDNGTTTINVELNLENEHNYHYYDNDTYNYGDNNYGHNYENEGHYGDGGDHNQQHYGNDVHYGDCGGDHDQQHYGNEDHYGDGGGYHDQQHYGNEGHYGDGGGYHDQHYENEGHYGDAGDPNQHYENEGHYGDGGDNYGGY